MNDKKTYGFTTTILHSDRQKGIEHGSLHKPIHTSVTFGYEDARQLAEVFQGKQPGYRYGRQGNPTVSALEDKITKMEDGKSTICFATGMAAIGAIVQGLLREGDHVVSSAFLFGNTNSLWMTVGAQGAINPQGQAALLGRAQGGQVSGNGGIHMIPFGWIAHAVPPAIRMVRQPYYARRIAALFVYHYTYPCKPL